MTKAAIYFSAEELITVLSINSRLKILGSKQLNIAIGLIGRFREF
jgi:hypothetical protein